MFESIINFFKKLGKQDKTVIHSKDAAKERLHLVLMQDRANVSADFLDLMKQEIIEVIKKYIDVDESEIDVRLANKTNEDGTTGAPALYANIPIISIKEEAKNGVVASTAREEEEQEESKDDVVASTAREEEEQEESKDDVVASTARAQEGEQEENKDDIGASIARPKEEQEETTSEAKK